MSKSAGNFLTIEQSIEQFSADATRVAFADAGKQYLLLLFLFLLLFLL